MNKMYLVTLLKLQLRTPIADGASCYVPTLLVSKTQFAVNIVFICVFKPDIAGGSVHTQDCCLLVFLGLPVEDV